MLTVELKKSTGIFGQIPSKAGQTNDKYLQRRQVELVQFTT